MPICSNPNFRRIRIPVSGGSVILVLRDYTAEEYTRFMSGRYEVRRDGQFEDRSMPARVDFIDALLVDVAARDAEGNEDYVSFVDPRTGAERRLSPRVEGWKAFVNPSWKIAAALELENEAAEIEDNLLKN